MLKIKCWLHKWNEMGITAALMPATMGIVLMTAMAKPASAQVERGRGMTTTKIRIPASQPVIVDQGNAPTSYIYGSPIPTPIPVNPVTGQAYRYESGRRTVVNGTPLNPVLVNPTIQDSTLINPVIINQQEYRRPGIYRRSPRVYYPYGY